MGSTEVIVHAFLVIVHAWLRVVRWVPKEKVHATSDLGEYTDLCDPCPPHTCPCGPKLNPDADTNSYQAEERRQNMALDLLDLCQTVVNPQTPENDIQQLCEKICHIKSEVERPEGNYPWGYKKAMLRLCTLLFVTCITTDTPNDFSCDEAPHDVKNGSALIRAFIGLRDFPFWNRYNM